jgi:hypothetical protein
VFSKSLLPYSFLDVLLPYSFLDVPAFCKLDATGHGQSSH